MKRLALLLVLFSTSAYAEGLQYFSGSNGERGTITRMGGITFYHSNRGSGMGSEIGDTMYWHGHRPGGGSGKECDTRMEWCD